MNSSQTIPSNDPSGDRLAHLPKEVCTYLTKLQDALIIALGSEQVIQIWLIGSASYSFGYIHGVSDLDVTVVTRDRLPKSALERVPALCSHRVLPCPATKLELVIYAYEAVHLDEPKVPYAISLNFNTGRAQSKEVVRYGSDPKDSPHWFVLDIEAAHTSNCPLLEGPAYSRIFTPMLEREQVVQAIQTSIQWHIDNEATSSNAVLNACRGWRKVCQGVFGSKLEGGEYALSRLRDMAEQAKEAEQAVQAVQTALLMRRGGSEVNAHVELKDAESLYAMIAEEVQTA